MFFLRRSLAFAGFMFFTLLAIPMLARPNVTVAEPGQIKAHFAAATESGSRLAAALTPLSQAMESTTANLGFKTVVVSGTVVYIGEQTGLTLLDIQDDEQSILAVGSAVAPSIK